MTTTPTTKPTLPRSSSMPIPSLHHRGILPLLLDISADLSISPTTQSLTHSKRDSVASLSTLQSSQHPNMPKKVLKFTDPNPHSVGMITAIAWRKEQLQRARERWDQRNAQRIQEGHLPMTHHSHALRDYADSAMDHSSIVMDTPLPNHSLSDRENLDTHLLQPPHPNAWSLLKAEVASPSRWLGTLSMQSSNTVSRWKTTPPLSEKTVKIPLRFRRPILPKGWAYEEGVAEEGGKEVKDEGTDQSQSSPSIHSNRYPRRSTREDKRASRPHPYITRSRIRH